MDHKKDKSILQSVTDAVKEIVGIASDAADHAMAPEPTTRAPEQNAYPAAEATPTSVPAIPKKRTTKRTVGSTDFSGRITPTYDFPPPDFPLIMPKKKAMKHTAKTPTGGKNTQPLIKKTAKPATVLKTGTTSNRKNVSK